MNILRIDEPIRVLADFSGGSVRPLRFRWAGRTCRVEAVNGQWVDRQGDHPSMHFSVQAGDETYLIHLASGDMQWWLDEVIAD
ncbi:MAG TPA: hypothetical protein VM389_03670 [Phycisphaerae bacterium]|nr:hypothetical protein [Phycisphaerae bacterium]